MPGPNFVLDKGFIIDAASNQFKCQKVVTATKEHATEAGAGEFAVGVLQETVSAADATAGRVCDIRIMGISRCIASAAIAIGDRVVVAATGKVATAAATTAKQAQVGIAMTAAAANNDHLDVLLTPGVQIDT